MHEDEIEIDDGLVERLVAAQFPELAGQPIRRVRSTGTVNALFRIGDDLAARLPRVAAWAMDLDKELQWLPTLAPRVSLEVPQPMARGEPAFGYPFTWAVYRWIEGEPYADDLVDDEVAAAHALAGFVHDLRAITPLPDAPRGGREPLRDVDGQTRAALEASRGDIDVEGAIAAWERSVAGEPFEGDPVWIHADLLRPNLLVRDGRLQAVIDFGSAGVGDPAADVIPAWTVFGPTGRATFRRALGVDDATWVRARGYALLQAAMIIPYYRVTNPRFVASATRTIEQILDDVAGR